MVDPLSSLMVAAQQIANNDSLSDNAYVYIKKGKIHTESYFSHLFTRSSTKQSTTQSLIADFNKHYGLNSYVERTKQKLGDRTLEHTSDPFFRSCDGSHQLTVGDLRKAFKTAEAAKLATLKEELTRVWGRQMGDALAPLVAHTKDKDGGTVSQKMIGKAIDKYFSRGTSKILFGNLKDQYVGNLPELMSAAYRIRDKAALLRDKPARVLRAVGDLCKGDLTKENVTETLKKHFTSDKMSEINGRLAALPAKPSFEEAVALLSDAERIFNAELLQKMLAKVGDDESLAASLGLPKMLKANEPLDPWHQETIESQLPGLRQAAQQLRNAAEQYIKENPELSRDGCNYVKSLAEKHIRENNFITGAEELKNAANVRKWRETNFDFGLNYELREHSNWSSAQKDFFKAVMIELHKGHKNTPLFAVGKPPMAERVATQVDKLFASPNDAIWNLPERHRAFTFAAAFQPYLTERPQPKVYHFGTLPTDL